MAIRRGPVIAIAVFAAVAALGVGLWISVQRMQAQGHIVGMQVMPGGMEAVVTLRYDGRETSQGYVARVGEGGARWYAHLPALPVSSLGASLLADDGLVVVRSAQLEPGTASWRQHVSAYDGFDGEPLWTHQAEVEDEQWSERLPLIWDADRVYGALPSAQARGEAVLHAWARETGEPVWSASLGRRLGASGPRLAGDVILANAADDAAGHARLVLLDAGSGEALPIPDALERLGGSNPWGVCVDGATLTTLRNGALVQIDLRAPEATARLPLSGAGARPVLDATTCGRSGDRFVFGIPHAPASEIVAVERDGEVVWRLEVPGVLQARHGLIPDRVTDAAAPFTGRMLRTLPIVTSTPDEQALAVVMVNLEEGSILWSGAAALQQELLTSSAWMRAGEHHIVTSPQEDWIAVFDGATGNLLMGQRLPMAISTVPAHAGGSTLWRATSAPHPFGELPWLRLGADARAIVAQGHPGAVTQEMTLELADGLGIPDEHIGK